MEMVIDFPGGARVDVVAPGGPLPLGRRVADFARRRESGRGVIRVRG